MLVASRQGGTTRILTTLRGVWGLEELWRVAPGSAPGGMLMMKARPPAFVQVDNGNNTQFNVIKRWVRQPVEMVRFVDAVRPAIRFRTPGTLYVLPTDDWRVLCALPDDCSFQGTPTNIEHRNVLPTWALAHLGAVCVHCGADLTGTDRQTWVEPECAGGCAA